MGADAGTEVLKKQEGSIEASALISYYRSLSGSERRRLTKWVTSPAHNQRPDVVALHTYLTKANRLDKTDCLLKKRIWKATAPRQEAFDDAKLRQTLHWALRTIEEFLAYEHWSRREMNVELALLRETRERGLLRPTERAIRRSRQRQSREPYRNEFYYRDQFLLESEIDAHRSLHRPADSPNFQAIADHLDVSYLIEKLRVSCNMLFHHRLYRTKFDLAFVAETAAHVRQLDLERHPALAIHYYGYLGLTEDDETGAIIRRLRDLTDRHEELLNPLDLRHLILMAINLCISNFNRGREAYVQEALAWYRLGFRKNAITENGKVTRATFMNVVTIGLKSGEYDWVATFLNEYAPLLDHDTRENTERFCRARLAYERGQHGDAMRQLVLVDFRHPVYNLLAKTLLLKNYYELNEYDALENLLDAMATYIRRKQLSPLHQENFGNIIRYVRQMSRLLPGDRKKRAALREQVAGEKKLSEKKWLLAQLS